jgi:2-hydroxycyclohexanecarboxyl-CoA dehydrogenase
MTDQDKGTVIITGAASERGIGRELARRFAGAGWSAGLLDIDPGVEKVAVALGSEYDAAESIVRDAIAGASRPVAMAICPACTSG